MSRKRFRFDAPLVCGAFAALVAGISIGCGGGDKQAAAPSEATHADAVAPPIVPAPAITQASWSPDALEELLAPIALYPDVLLSQVLAASVNAQEVLDAGNWLLQNESLQGEQLDAAAQAVGFGPAIRALVHFPSVVDMLCQEIDWTRQIGSAFTSDQKAVLDAVQRLRLQAADVGNLKSTPQQTVETKVEADKTIVEVKPAAPTVIYVPQYDPQVVYTTPPPATTTTVVQEGVSTEAAIATGVLAFGAGILLANAFDDDDYCYPHWGHGGVYYGGRPFYPPAYVYRPAYGPAFRPAYGYAPPAGYRHSYNNVNIDRNLNVNIDNDNYFNRFDNNNNLRGSAAQSPLRKDDRMASTRDTPGRASASQLPATNRGENRGESWKGQSTYAGARENPVSDNRGTARSDRSSVPRREEANAAMDTDRRALADSRADSPRVDRGYDEARRESARNDSSRNDVPAARVDDRQTRQMDRDTSAAARPNAAPARDHAFAGADEPDRGSFDRAASARGNASTRQQGGSRGGGGRRR